MGETDRKIRNVSKEEVFASPASASASASVVALKLKLNTKYKYKFSFSLLISHLDGGEQAID